MSFSLTLAHIGRRLERRSSRHLPISQYRVLAMAASSPETSGRLSRRLELAKPTITAAVDGLVEAGLLARHDVEGDRRSISLLVTETGRRKLEEVEAELEQAINDLVEGCDDPELVRAALSQLGVAIERRATEREASRQEKPVA